MIITPSISLVASGKLGFGLTDDFDCHTYWIDGGNGAAVMIDAGGGRDLNAIKQIVQRDGRRWSDLTAVLLTHYHADHAAGAAAIKQDTGCQVICAHDAADAIRTADEKQISLDFARDAGVYPTDFQFPPCVIDRTVGEGDTFDVNSWRINVVDTPSQSAGHLCFHAHIDGLHVLFSGDAVFFGGKILLIATHDCNLQQYAASVIKLDTLGINALLPGHGAFDLTHGGDHVHTAANLFRNMCVPPNIF